MLLHSLIQGTSMCHMIFWDQRDVLFSQKKTAKNGNTPWHNLSFNSNLKELKVFIHISPCFYQSEFVPLQALSSAAFFCRGKLVILYYCPLIVCQTLLFLYTQIYAVNIYICFQQAGIIPNYHNDIMSTITRCAFGLSGNASKLVICPDKSPSLTGEKFAERCCNAIIQEK